MGKVWYTWCTPIENHLPTLLIITLKIFHSTALSTPAYWTFNIKEATMSKSRSDTSYSDSMGNNNFAEKRQSHLMRMRACRVHPPRRNWKWQAAGQLHSRKDQSRLYHFHKEIRDAAIGQMDSTMQTRNPARFTIRTSDVRCASGEVRLITSGWITNADKMVPHVLVVSEDSALHQHWKMLICGGSSTQSDGEQCVRA